MAVILTIAPEASNLLGGISIQENCDLTIDLSNCKGVFGVNSFTEGYNFNQLKLTINGFKNKKFFLESQMTMETFNARVSLTVSNGDATLTNSDFEFVQSTHPEYGKVWYLHTSKMPAPTPFAQWAEDNNLLDDDAKFEAIAHNDGITNLEKFVFGLPANRATSYAENANFKQTNDDTTATFQFPLNKNVSLATKAKSATSGATVKVLVSEDLVNWSETTATQSGESGDFNLYKVEMPIPEGGKLFFKVEASQE